MGYLPKLAEFYKQDISDLVKFLCEDGVTFNSSNQNGGVTNMIFHNTAEQELIKELRTILTELRAENEHKNEEIRLLRRMLEEKKP